MTETEEHDEDVSVVLEHRTLPEVPKRDVWVSTLVMSDWSEPRRDELVEDGLTPSLDERVCERGERESAQLLRSRGRVEKLTDVALLLTELELAQVDGLLGQSDELLAVELRVLLATHHAPTKNGLSPATGGSGVLLLVDDDW